MTSPECVGIVGAFALQAIIEASSNSGNGPSMGDVNPNVFGGSDAGLSLGMSRNQAFIEQDLPPTASLQVQGLGTITRSNAFGIQLFEQCGPHTLRFQPKADRAYLVEFVFEGGSCRMDVSDATDPDAPSPVSAEKLSECGKR